MSYYTKIECPKCPKSKHYVEAVMQYTTHKTGNYYICPFCFFKILESNLNMKKIKFQYILNKTAVQFVFETKPIKGWFNANVKPVIDVLKAVIPATERTYDPITYQWTISIQYWEAYQQILKADSFTFIEVSNLNSDPNEPKVDVPKDYAENFYTNTSSEPLTTKENPATIAASLSAYLGTDVSTQDVISLKRLYRQKARELHPDLNPSPVAASEMAELNRLWTIFNSSTIN